MQKNVYKIRNMKFLLSGKKLFSFLNADVLGMTSSVLCLLHCLFLPLFLILQPVLFSFVKDLEDNVWWEYLDYVFLAIGLFAVILATKKIANTRKILFYGAYSVFALGILLSENWVFLSYLGSFGLVVLHLVNYKQHRNCKI